MAEVAFANKDSDWAVGKHPSSMYNMTGPDGGLYWEQLEHDWRLKATQEEQDASAARAELIKQQFRKRR